MKGRLAHAGIRNNDELCEQLKVMLEMAYNTGHKVTGISYSEEEHILSMMIEEN